MSDCIANRRNPRMESEEEEFQFCSVCGRNEFQITHHCNCSPECEHMVCFTCANDPDRQDYERLCPNICCSCKRTTINCEKIQCPDCERDVHIGCMSNTSGCCQDCEEDSNS